MPPPQRGGVSPPALPAVAAPPGAGSRWWGSALVLAALLAGTGFALVTGAVPITLAELGQVLSTPPLGGTSAGEDSLAHTVIWSVRLPRLILALAVGAGLAMCGAVLQSLVRNPLADPYILGVNAGAGCGAAAAILFGAGSGLGGYAIQGSAFLGAALTMLLVLALARGGGARAASSLVIAGVGVGHLMAAATSLLVFLSDSAEGSRAVLFWLLGSLAAASWSPAILVVCVVVLLMGALMTALGPRLDALSLGASTAATLGVSARSLTLLLLLATSLTVGVAVALAGSIGFIGLIAPHLARALAGARHRHLLPLSALVGATLLVWADVLARTVLAPQEIPIGILTALVGAPVFLLLLFRHRSTT